MSDLTARARLRIAAQRLFAENGYAGTSTRAIAHEAGVSHALLRHHFGSKAGLQQAVDEHVLTQLGSRLDEAGRQADPDRVLESMGQITAHIFGADTAGRRYLRRRLLDGDHTATALFDRLIDGTRTQLAQLGHQPTRTEPEHTVDWAPYQVLFLILGPLLLEDLLHASLDADPFDGRLLQQRSKANQRLIAAGLLPRDTPSTDRQRARTVAEDLQERDPRRE